MWPGRIIYKLFAFIKRSSFKVHSYFKGLYDLLWKLHIYTYQSNFPSAVKNWNTIMRRTLTIKSIMSWNIKTNYVDILTNEITFIDNAFTKSDRCGKLCFLHEDIFFTSNWKTGCSQKYCACVHWGEIWVSILGLHSQKAITGWCNNCIQNTHM